MPMMLHDVRPANAFNMFQQLMGLENDSNIFQPLIFCEPHFDDFGIQPSKKPNRLKP